MLLCYLITSACDHHCNVLCSDLSSVCASVIRIHIILHENTNCFNVASSNLSIYLLFAHFNFLLKKLIGSQWPRYCSLQKLSFWYPIYNASIGILSQFKWVKTHVTIHDTLKKLNGWALDWRKIIFINGNLETGKEHTDCIKFGWKMSMARLTIFYRRCARYQAVNFSGESYRDSCRGVYLPTARWSVISSVTRLGDLLHVGQPFKACGNNCFAQITHIFMQFLQRCQKFHFWATFIDIWRLFTGHTGYQLSGVWRRRPAKKSGQSSGFV